MAWCGLHIGEYGQLVDSGAFLTMIQAMGVASEYLWVLLLLGLLTSAYNLCSNNELKKAVIY